MYKRNIFDFCLDNVLHVNDLLDEKCYLKSLVDFSNCLKTEHKFKTLSFYDENIIFQTANV